MDPSTFPDGMRRWTPPASFTGAAAGGTRRRPEPTVTSVAVGRLGVVVNFLRDRRQLDLAVAVENIIMLVANGR